MKRKALFFFLPSRFALMLAPLLAAWPVAPVMAQTYTSPNSLTLTNIVGWNLGAGPIPFSSATGTLNLQSFGTTGVTLADDLNLTLQTLQLNTFGTAGSTLSSLLGGNLAFTGAGQIQQLGSGAVTTISAPLNLASTATGLSITGSGLGNTTISGAISSGTATGAPLTIGLTTGVPNFGTVTLSGTNTFGGGVVLNGGNLALGSASALGVLGNNFNTLTVNGGSLQGTQTVLNPIVLNSTLTITGGTTGTTFGAAGGLGLGVISGAGGVTVQPGGSGQTQIFNVANTYSGATTIGQLAYAPTVAMDNPGALRLNSAAGSILNSSAINVRDGGIFEINKSGGDSINNARVSTGTAINVNSGFVQVIGSAGLTTTALGQINAAGATTFLANTTGAAGSATLVTSPNLVRTNSGTVVFSGANLGNAAAIAGVGAAQANILLTQINGAAPAAALVGGGGAAGTATISILPWAVGDAANTGTNFGAGTGFVTYDAANGVRLLNTTTEYSGVAAAASLVAGNNNRVTGAPAAQNSNIAVQSLFNTGAFNITGTGTIDITSGALAGTGGAYSIANPVTFGGGTGEAIISTIGALGGTNNLTMNGALTASTLTKGGQNTLILGNAGNAFSSNRITVNAGFLSVDALNKLGIANAAGSRMEFNMHSFINRGGFLYAGTGTETMNIPIAVNSGQMQLAITGAAGQLTVSGVISGDGGVNLNSNAAGSILTLGNANTFKGGVRIGGGAGSYIIPGDGAFGAAGGAITVNAAATQTKLSGNWTTARNIGFEAAWGTAATLAGFDTAGFNSTWSGPITGSAAIFRTDSSVTPGTWSITGANNSYSGTITLGNNTQAGGTLAISGAGELNEASVTFGAGATSVAGTYRLDLSGATAAIGTPWRQVPTLTTATGFTQAHQVQLGSTLGTPVDLRVGAGTFGGTAGVIQGFGKLVKVGTGSLTLATANTFTGNVEVWGGTLAITNDNQLGNGANALTLRGGTLSIPTASVSLGAGRAVSFDPTPTTLGGAAPANALNIASTFSLTIPANITGGGGFEKSGLGSLILTGTNSFGSSIGSPLSGFTKVNQGAVVFNSDANLGSQASGSFTGNKIVLLSLGAQNISATADNVGTLRLAAGQGAQTINRHISFQNANTNQAAIDVGSGSTLTYQGTLISGINTQQLFKTGAGAMTFDANGSLYYGTFSIGNGLAGGTTGNVTLGSSGQLPRATVSVAANSTATLDMTNLTREFGALNTAAGTSVQLGTSGQVTTGFINGGNHTWAGNLLGGAGASVTKLGTGSLAITSNGNTFSGGFTNLFGATTLSGAGTLPLQSSFTVGGWGDQNGIGTSFTLDNTATGVNDRIADTQNLAFRNSALVFSTNTTTANTEVINSLQGSGYNTVTMTTGGTLNFASATTGLTRTNNGTFLFRAGSTSFGTAAASASVPNLLFGNIAPGNLIGGTGLAGSTEVPILPYVVSADTGTAGSTGNSFATYGAANGIRPLNTGTEYLATFTGATANSNVRFGTSSTLTANQDLNSFIITGASANTARYDGSFNLIANSGAIANTVTQVYHIVNGIAGQADGLQMAELQTGAGNTRELIFHNLAADLNVGAKISTSGGLTKSGGGQLFLSNAANTYTGATTVNTGSLVVDSTGALGGSTSLQLGGGYLKYRGGNATLSQSVIAAGTGGIHVVSGTTLTLGSGALSGAGGFMKEGTGTLVLQGANTLTGDLLIQAGNVAISAPAALGSAPRIVFVSNNTGGNAGGALQFNAPMTLTQDVTTFTGSATYGMGFNTNGNAVTVSGNISSPNSTRGLIKFGSGDLTLTAANTYIGATQVFGGNLVLGGANGAINGSSGTGGFLTTDSIVVNPGAGLILDNTAANNNNRIPDAWNTTNIGGNGTSGGIRLNGGDFTLKGNASGTAELVNLFEVLAGTVTLSGGGTTLTSGRILRTDSASASLVRGTNLGGTPGSGSTNWFSIDLGGGSTQLGGALGAAGTPYVGTLGGFMADPSATGSGTDLATYSSDVGVRPLTNAEYATAFVPNVFNTSRAPNIVVSGALSAGSESTAAAALKLTAGAALGGTSTLSLTNSTILATGTSSINTPVLNWNIAGNNAGFAILTSGAATNLTISSTLNSGRIVKYGDGTLTLTGVTSGSGAVTVAQGTLALSGTTAALAPLGSPVTVMPGATLDLGGLDRRISSLNTTALLSTSNLGQISDGTISLGAGSLTLYDTTFGTFTGNISGSGGLIKALHSTGISNLSEPQAFTGTTRINNGTLQLSTDATLASTLINIRGGNLTFNNADDSSAATGHLNDRISAPVNLAGGLTFTGNANAIANHTLSTLTLVGSGTLTATAGGAPMTITTSNLTRNADKGTLTTAGTNANFGLTPSPIGNARIFATQINGAAPAAALAGGSGADGTNTVSILPWAINTSGTTSFLTYGANGLRPLNTVAGAGTEYATVLPGAPSDDNVRLIAVATLAAGNTEANAILNTGVNVTGADGAASTLTVRSGALAFGGAAIAGPGLGGTLALNFGTSNTREAVVYNTAAVTLNGVISTTGGVTKFGGGALTLSQPNSFTGGLAIQDGRVSFTTDANLGVAGGAISFGGAGPASITANTPAAGLTYAGTTPLVMTRPITTNSAGTLTGVTNVIWQGDSAISGTGAIAYAGPSAIHEINGANTYTGATDWFQGHLAIKNDAAFGNSGELLLNSNATSNIVLRNNWTTSRFVHAVAANAIDTNGYDATWNGQFAGAGALTKNGLGALVLTNANPYTGSLTANAGDIRLFNNGSIAATGTHSFGFGTSLILDDSGTHMADRIPDTGGAITANNSNVVLRGNASVTTEEVLGSLTLGVQTNVTIQPGAGQAAILRLTGTLTRSATSSLLFRGDNLGVNAPGTANSANFMLNSPLSSTAILTGGGAAAGNSAISIIAGAFGDTSSTGFGTQLVTYDLAKGIRLLNLTEYATGIPNGTVMQDNVRVSASTASLANATTVNALWLDNGGTVTGAGTLTVTAGNVLSSGAGNTISAPISAGASALAFGGAGSVAVTTAIPAAQTGGLIKTGAGTLSLNTANSYTGTTTISSGTIRIGNAAAFAATTVRFLGGSVANTNGSPITVTNALALSGPMGVSGLADVTFSGNVSLESASRSFNITNLGRTTLSGIISQSSTSTAGIGLIKDGSGLLELTGANTYGNSTTNNLGGWYLSTTTVNAGELRVNNLTGSGTGGSMVEVNSGGTLGGIGTIIPTQGSESRNTVTIRSGGTLAPGNSPGILTIGSSTTPGVTTANVTLESGATFKFQYTGTPASAAPDTGTSLTPGPTGNSRVTVNGALNISNNAVFSFTGNFADFAPGQDYSFLVGSATSVANFDISSTVSPGLFDTSGFTGWTPGVFDLRWRNSGTNVFLNMTQVPEPGATALAAIGAALLLRRRRHAAGR